MPVEPIEPIRVWRKGSVNLVRQSLHVFFNGTATSQCSHSPAAGEKDVLYIRLISKVGWFIHVLQHYT